MENLRLDSELPNKMASLDIWEPGNAIKPVNESDENSSSGHAPSRRTSKRLTQSPNKVTNRRVILKPKKRQLKMSMTEDELTKYYCNQEVKTVSQTLETIFEEPKTVNSNNTTIMIGSKKIKRFLTFHDGSNYTKEKIKKRKLRIKRLLGTRNFLKRKKLSMQTFIKNLQTLDPEESISDNIQSFFDNDNKQSFETKE